MIELALLFGDQTWKVRCCGRLVLLCWESPIEIKLLVWS